jgi:hypothetical protein
VPSAQASQKTALRIEVLVDEAADANEGYLIMRIASRWRQAGHQVDVRNLSFGPGTADLYILHVDQSVINPARLEPFSSLPVVNGGALDITKRRVSRHLLSRDDEYQGPVIIKTDLNSWGDPEWEKSRPNFLQRLCRRWKTRLPWRLTRSLPPRTYPWLPSLQDVPGWVWANPAFVVERFIPEIDDGHYVTHYWVFLGRREFVYTKWSEHYLVKEGLRVKDQLRQIGVPDELRRRRQELGLDYGKFDWVVSDGRPVLLDANKTPWFANVVKSFPEIPDILAPGLEDVADLLPRQSSASHEGDR